MNSQKEKSRLDTLQTAPENTISEANSAISDRLQEDPLLGWYGLASGVKQSRTRPMKRGWIRKGGR